MRIDAIASKPDRLSRYRVALSDGSVMRLYRQTVEDFGLFPGMELTDGMLAELKDKAGQMSAKMRAVRIVSAANVSVRDLEQRLVQKGEAQDQAKAAVAWLEDLNLVNDGRTAAQIVSGCISKGYGLARAKQALFEKKIPREYWEEALSDYPDQTDAILKFLRSRLTDPDDPKQVKRAADALLRRGHSWTEIRRGLSQFVEDADAFQED